MDIRVIIGRSHPQAQNVGAVLIDDRLRVDAVAQRLTHLAAFVVDDPAMRADGFIRCLAAPGNARQKARLEPAAVLVRALQVEVGRPVQFRALIRDSRVGNTGVEPNVHNVAFLDKRMAAALRTGRAFGQDLLGLGRIPGIAALFAEELRNTQHEILAHQRLAAILAVEDRDRHTPAALAGNAPVVALAHHGRDAVLAPGRNPLDLVDRVDGLLLDRIHRAEPLLRRAEQNRVLAAPAVRVLVDDVLLGKHRAALDEIIGNRLVCLLRGHPRADGPRLLGHAAVRIDWDQDRQLGIMVVADIVVVNAVAGRRMDAARAAFKRDVVADDD